MTVLIAMLSIGKGSWNEVTNLIKQDCWSNIFLMTNSFGKENFRHLKKEQLLEINAEKPISSLREDIKNILSSRLAGETEVALNLSSGSGKEHAALISALLSLGLGIRLVTAENGKVVEL